jgi:HEAT repeat protein
MESEDIILLMRQYAGMPEQAPQSRQLRDQLVVVKAEVLDIFLSGDIKVQLLAASTLARIDPSQAEIVLPKLIRGLQSVVEYNRVLGAIGCKALGPLAFPAVDALISILEIEDENTNLFSCGRAINALKTIGPAAAIAIPTLIRMLCVDHETSVLKVIAATAAADALSAIGARAAIPDLRDCLDIESDDFIITELRLAAAKAIYRISGDVETALGVAMEALDNPEISIRLTAVNLLGEIGLNARCFLPELRRLLENEEGAEFLHERVEEVVKMFAL